MTSHINSKKRPASVLHEPAGPHVDDTPAVHADKKNDTSVFDGTSAARKESADASASVALQSPATAKPAAVGVAGVPPLAIGAPGGVLHYIAQKIDHADLPQARKEALLADLGALTADIKNAGPQLFPVYLMEGAVGVKEKDGRPSTDPDENMALKAIAFRTHVLHEAAVVAVPDAANQSHTRQFLHDLGAKTAEYVPGQPLKKGIVYVARMDKAQDMQDVVAQSPHGREVFLLGPGLGHAVDLLDGNPALKVSAMGAMTVQQGKIKRSTNFRDCPQAFLDRINDLSAEASSPHKRVEMYPSSPTKGLDVSMKGISVSLYEVMLTSGVVTRENIEHWASNSKDQFLGIVDGFHNLLTKRLDNAKAGELYRDVAFNWPEKGEGLVYLPFLETVHAAELQSDSILKDLCQRLGDAYGYLETDEGSALAKDNLQNILGAHRGTAEFAARIAKSADKPDVADAYETGYQAGIKLIDDMSGAHARYAFAALASAFKDIYDEKAREGAWHDSDKRAKQQDELPGQQWVADNFVKTYLALPGQQIPYDTVVAVKSILGGFPKNADERAAFTNKMLLVFMSELKEIDA